MPLDLSEILVIGVSSRSLFNLEDENNVFEEQGISGFRKYKVAKENETLQPAGIVFYLIKSLLEFNNQANKKIVEVVILSKNSPETGVRVLNSIKYFDLYITRLVLSGGEPLVPYIDAFDVDLFFLSKDVQIVIDSGTSATSTIYDPLTTFDSTNNRAKIAFVADAVLFDVESELRYKTESMEAFHKHEAENEDNPLNEGLFANLLRMLSEIQEHLPTSIELTPLHIAIVTARNPPSHMRVIKTLRNWGVYVYEAYFMGDVSKDKVLKAFGAHIFFDDQNTPLTPTSKVVSSSKIPYSSKSPLKKLNKDEQKRYF